MPAACHPAAPPPAPETAPPPVLVPDTVKKLSPADAALWMQQHPEGLILDLRMEEETVREGKLAGAVNHDFLQPEAFQSFLTSTDKTQPVLLVCALGGRAEKAAVQMTGMGFTQLSILAGGQEAWQAEGRAVQK